MAPGTIVDARQTMVTIRLGSNITTGDGQMKNLTIKISLF
jgi:hypothetical protein